MLAIASALTLLAGHSAAAQVPDICDQYPELPQCVQGDVDAGGPGGDRDDDLGPDEAGAGPIGGGGKPGGELPFTGYPLSPALLLALLLLLLGAVLRIAIAARDHWAARRPVVVDGGGLKSP